jgi:hypothetical protein
MKKILWLWYLSVFVVFTPLLALNSTHVWSASNKNTVQKSGYNQFMLQGYAATAKRSYPLALSWFQKALKERPGDKYAIAAIRNVEGYVKRDRNARLVFVAVGKPGNRTSAASRSGSCTQGTPSLLSLVPKAEPQYTATGYPTFLFYVPQNTAQAFELIVEDETSDNPLYKKTFKSQPKSGVISVSLPQNANVPALEIDKQYKWTFSLVCDTRAIDKNINVEGAIVRSQPDANLSTLLKTAQPRERVSLYAASGFWFDTVAGLADLRRQRPNDATLKADWQDLLKSVGLESYAKAPLLDCCQVSK